jgi:signal transduction histidine kinase/CheY-like chemotaxis protein
VAASDREQAERIRALYGNVPAGVSVMLLGVVSVSGGVVYLAPDRLPQLRIWIGASLAIAALQLGLWLWRRRAWTSGSDWRRWRDRLALACLADGARWGWATLGIAPLGAADLQVWVCMIVGGATCASVASWGNYTRVYYAMLFPAMVPYVLWAATVPDPRYRGVAVLGSILTVAMAWLSRRQSRAFAEAVRLRFENQDLAERLREQKELAEQANLAKTQFLAAASHDLRQPVHALGMFVAALRRSRMDAAGGRLTRQIAETVEAMDGLFESLLDISQLDAGMVRPEARAFASGPLIARICREQAPQLRDRPVRLRWVDCAAVVETDPVLLERMLRNLIGNAVRHTREGRVLVGARRRGRRLVVEVWDTGPGIPAAQHAQVFQEYFQLGNPERDRTKGLGLGLAITRRLARLLDCPLDLRSAPGQGSMFSVSIPRAARAAAAAEPAEAAAPQAGLVFVVDDEALVQESTARLLETWGYAVVTGGSADELLSRAAGRTPDLVICDWRLRGEETAPAVIERIRRACGVEAPALLITGDTAPDRLRAAHETGLALLHKPVAPARLRAAVGNLTRAPPSAVR